jgi:hypothetical protein
MGPPTSQPSSAASSPRVMQQPAGASVSAGGAPPHMYMPSNLGRTVSSPAAAASGNMSPGPLNRLVSAASSAFSDSSEMQLSRLASSLQASSSMGAGQGEELLLQHLRSGDPALMAALAAGGGRRQLDNGGGSFDLQLGGMSRTMSSSSGSGVVHVHITTPGGGAGVKGQVQDQGKVGRSASLLDLATATMAAASAVNQKLPQVGDGGQAGLKSCACCCW